MKYIYTSEQAKQIDTHAIETMGFPSLVLMERAAMSVAAVITEKISHEQSIICVCGMGNNGGDGVAVARMLRQSGYNACICMVGEPERMSEETKKQLELAINCRVRIVKAEAIPMADIVVDALFGIGLSKPITGVYAKVIQMMNEAENVIFAVDIPSGIHGSTGQVMGTAVYAQETITFGVHKLGMILYPGAEFAGHIHVADIGLPVRSVAAISNPISMYEEEDLCRLPLRPDYSNKGTFGKVLVIAGSENMCGAAFFAAKAAYLMGAGLVRILSTDNNRDVLLGKLPEAIFSSYNELDAALQWADIIVMGPGMGLSKRAKDAVYYVLKNVKKPTVIDGDGIVLAKGCKLGENVVITPHLKEMASFLDCEVDEIRADLIQNALETARKSGCTVVLKDSRSIVSQGEEIYLNVSGNNGMATGGSGDVLSGVIGGLLAGGAAMGNVNETSIGMEIYEAAKLGVYLHGVAGDRATLKKGPYAVMASDILENLWSN